MAYDDVYKLVQQQLAQGQGKGRNQFYDPTVDFAMKIPEMIQNEKDKKDVANKDSLTNIASLIDKVNTPEGFANINSSLNDLENNSDGNSEINTNIAILRGINKTSQQNYNTYKEGVDRGLEYVDSDSFPKDMKSYQNLGEIALNGGFKNEDGTGNQLEYLYAEKEKINAIMDKLSLGTDGKTQKFSYGKGVDRSVLRKLQEHNNQIDIAVKTLAGDGIITKDEAYHIMSGDSKFYAEDKKNALSEARDILKSGMSTNKSLTNLLSKNSFDDDDHDLLAGYDINSKELVETEGGREVINSYIQGAMTRNNQRMQINNQKYKDWSGRNYDPSLAMGKSFYTDDDDVIGGESVEVDNSAEGVGASPSSEVTPSKTKEQIKEDSTYSPSEEDVVIGKRKVGTRIVDIKAKPVPDNFLQKAFDESSYNANEGKVLPSSDIINWIDYEIDRLKSSPRKLTGKSDRENRRLSVSDLKSLKSKMSQYAKKLKTIKNYTSKGKKIPQGLREEINLLINSAEKVFNQEVKTGPIDYGRSSIEQKQDKIREQIKQIEEELLATNEQGIRNINNMSYPLREKLKEISSLKKKLK